MRNNICDAFFYTYNISNFVVNSVIFLVSNNVKYLLLPLVVIIPSISSNLIRKGFKPIIKFYLKYHKSKYFHLIICILKDYEDQNLLI